MSNALREHRRQKKRPKWTSAEIAPFRTPAPYKKQQEFLDTPRKDRLLPGGAPSPSCPIGAALLRMAMTIPVMTPTLRAAGWGVVKEQ